MCPPRCQRASHDARTLAHDLRRNPLDPPDHLGRRPAGKSQEQDAAWIGALDNQVRHAVRQSVGLARASARNDQERFGGAISQRPDAMFDDPSLFRIELGKVGGGHGRIVP